MEEENQRTARDIRIVLVDPTHPGNVGAAARAMKTMGLEDLVLVRPAEFPSYEAERRAVAAADVLERARVVDDLSDAVGDCALVIGTTGRAREYAHPVLDAREAGPRIVAEAKAGASVAVLFGTERTGLSNDSLNACNYQLLIPTGEALSSLNLAAAVQLVCYEILMADSTHETTEASTRSLPSYPTQKEVEFFYQRLLGILEARDYFDAVNPVHTFTKIRRIFGRARMDAHELSLVHGLVGLMARDD